MRTTQYIEYRVKLSTEKDSGMTIAEVPTLGIADQGKTPLEALTNIRKMVEFHLDCLLEEGSSIPTEKRGAEGFYLKVRHPVRAA